nr:heterogeneous nuclear ribonucleoprotein L-like [Setaria viridis]
MAPISDDIEAVEESERETSSDDDEEEEEEYIVKHRSGKALAGSDDGSGDGDGNDGDDGGSGNDGDGDEEDDDNEKSEDEYVGDIDGEKHHITYPAFASLFRVGDDNHTDPKLHDEGVLETSKMHFIWGKREGSVGAERCNGGELRVVVKSGGVPTAAALFAGNGRARELHEGETKRRVVSARCGVKQR